MHVKRTVLTSVITSVLALTLSGTPALSQAPDPAAKPDPASGPGAASQRLLATERAMGRAAAVRAARVAKPAVNAARDTVQTRIAEYVRDAGTQYAFGSFVDPASGKLVIETDAPPSVVSSLVGSYAAVVSVRPTRLSDNFSRRSDVPAFWGGSGVTASVGVPWCSMGFAVQDAAGGRHMVTAGHCFADGTAVVTENGGVPMGSVSGRSLPSMDMELVSGSAYGSAIFVEGVDSSVGNAVVAAGDPVVGFNAYCHSGRTTGENCGHTVNSVTAQVCTSSGCKSPVISFTGGVSPAGGDSGSPFYAKDGVNVHIRGIIIAGDGVTTYAEPYSRIASRFGVTVG